MIRSSRPAKRNRARLPRLVALGALASSLACESVVERSVRVILPEDRTPLESIDNASLVLLPDGSITSFGIEGLDFELELDLPDDAGPFSLELFLARGSELAAWGRSSPFSPVADLTPSIYVGPPGAVSTFPRSIDDPDPGIRAIPTEGGALLVRADGETFFLSDLTLDTSALSGLEAPERFGDAGRLWPGPVGGALRLRWGGEAAAAYFDREAGSWREVELDDPSGLLADLPEDAPSAPSESAQWVIYGATGLVRLQLELEGERPTLRVADGSGPAAPDGDRSGGVALWTETEGGTLWVFGGAAELPLLWNSRQGPRGESSGRWTAAACVARAENGRYLCAGGVRDGNVTSDGADLELGAADPLTLRPGALVDPMADPFLWKEADALYAQGEGRLRALPLDGGSPQGEASFAARHAGGRFFRLATGATFLVGGTDSNGDPLTRWQVFSPALTP